MEEDGEQTPRTPFWVQSTTNVHRIELYRRRISSLIFNSGVLIIFLLFLAIISMVFIIPSLISFTSHIFKPNLVKKSWDSINLILVLFALAFGFLSKTINHNNNNNYNDELRSGLLTGTPVTSPLTGNQSQWYDFPEQPIVGLRRHRSSSSYPDLRELSPPWNHRRFSDDTHLNYDRYYFREDIKDVIHDDTVVDLDKNGSFAPPSPAVVEDVSHSPAPLPPCPSSPPPQPVVLVEKGGSLESNKVFFPKKEPESPENQDSGNRGEKGVRKRGKGERRRARSMEPRIMVTSSNDPDPEMASPATMLPEIHDSDQKTGKIERKRSGTNATKEFFSSFYQKKKKKRQRQRSVDNLDTFLHHSQPPVKIQLPPPPSPPPPPPPPSILNNLFTSKKERRKKNSTPTPPPPPPPPTVARGQPYLSATARAPRPTTTRVPPFVTQKPRLPVKMSFFNGIDDGSSGGESPMSRIPPPPPMPPFKMPDWKFAVEGDYVRVQSTLSSGSGSPDGDESQSPSSAVASPAFCPSPDVDTKADTFIARFRAGLKLEKINSLNQNQSNRMSNLGPSDSNRF